MALTCFEADKDDIYDMVDSRTKTGVWRWAVATARGSALTTSLRRMHYAEDAAVSSRSSEQLKKMMIVTMAVFAAFTVIVSEAALNCDKDLGCWMLDAALTYLSLQ